MSDVTIASIMALNPCDDITTEYLEGFLTEESYTPTEILNITPPAIEGHNSDIDALWVVCRQPHLSEANLIALKPQFLSLIDPGDKLYDDTISHNELWRIVVNVYAQGRMLNVNHAQAMKTMVLAVL
jgi:hypothetical protein